MGDVANQSWPQVIESCVKAAMLMASAVIGIMAPLVVLAVVGYWFNREKK